MLDPVAIQGGIVTQLRSITALVTAMSVDTNISSHIDSYPSGRNVADAIHELIAPGLLVLWDGTEPGDLGQALPWKHRFKIVLAAEGAALTLAALIINGVVSDGVPFLECEVAAGLDPAETPLIQRETLDLGESQLDYVSILLTYAEQANRQV
jgi:hypothetical protein